MHLEDAQNPVCRSKTSWDLTETRTYKIIQTRVQAGLPTKASTYKALPRCRIISSLFSSQFSSAALPLGVAPPKAQHVQVLSLKPKEIFKQGNRTKITEKQTFEDSFPNRVT